MTAAPRPLFSIVIVTYGKRAVTERCLETLDAAFGERLGDDVELVLVDNASPDDTPDLLRAWEDRAKVILLEENLNYAGGNNVGARAATGEVLVLLNNDTEVTSGALDELAAAALEPGVGIAGCRLLYPDGTIQHGGCAWWSGPDGIVRPFHLFRYEAGDLPAACTTFDCDIVTAACITIRRSLFEEFGGFDEAFVNGWEDTDLCVRARLGGQRVVYRGDIAIVHAEGMTRGRASNEAANERQFAARYNHLLGEDTERLEALFDAAGPHMGLPTHPANLPVGSEISVEGEVTGLAPESAEARALLWALEVAELRPATRDWQPTSTLPRFTEHEWAPVQRGRLRALRRDALTLHAPVGRLGALEAHERSILRLAELPERDVSGAAAVWAASHALAEQLVAAGHDPERVEVLHPVVADLPLGTGGEGVLALLPAHDPALCEELLRGLAELPESVPVRLLPSVATEPLAALAAARLPRAEVLAPVTSEERFAALAAEADVAVCVDPRDRFERRALLAARTGATVVHLPGGVAEEILSAEHAYDGGSGVLQAALAAPVAREETAEKVRGACGPASLLRLRELIARAQQAVGAGRSLALS